MVLGLCERFGCLPSALLAEDAELLRMVRVEALGREVDPDGE
jgi:pyruvate/2-oxoglutarate dehydrogenase complex dihydrolipoamide dehydrogenase (E3) component